MITCYLQGGLGNQMFQIAATLALSFENDIEAVFNSNIHFSPLQGRDVKNYINNVFRNISFFSDFKPKFLYNEPHHEYSEIPFRDETCIKGYFQSEKYFQKHSDRIQKVFECPEDLKRELIKRNCDIFESKTVGVHVRRGDYLENLDIHPVCNIEYYEEALREMTSVEQILVFSDDIEWCKNNLKFDILTKFIEKQEDYEDFYLMSLCDNFIISNSTFSWWSAWLGETDDSVIVAPKKWFGPQGPSSKDIVPNRWIKK